MQKIWLLTFCFLFILVFGCKNKNERVAVNATSKVAVEKGPNVFPVTEFLKGQLNELEGLPITPMKVATVDGKTDSLWSKRENIRAFATPFLSPVIDSITMQNYYTSQSFLDQTIHAITLTYDSNNKLPENIALTHFDVYINPESGNVKRIYMVKNPSVDSTVQLTWTVDKGCSIVTIVQSPGKKPIIREEKMIWKFD